MSSAATPEFNEVPQPPTKKKISLKTSRAREKEKEAAQKKEQRPKTPPPVDERVAHLAMRHFIAAQLHQSGFSSASTPLLVEIERCTVQCKMSRQTLFPFLTFALSGRISSLHTNLLRSIAVCQCVI